MEDLVMVLLLKDGRTIVSKLKEVPEHEIGEPDCVMIDPVLYDDSADELEKSMTRFPGRRITQDTKMAIHSDSILTMVTPDNKLLSEYLITISD